MKLSKPARPLGQRLMVAYTIALAVATAPLAVIWVFRLGEILRPYSLTIAALSTVLLAWNVVVGFRRAVLAPRGGRSIRYEMAIYGTLVLAAEMGQPWMAMIEMYRSLGGTAGAIERALARLEARKLIVRDRRREQSPSPFRVWAVADHELRRPARPAS